MELSEIKRQAIVQCKTRLLERIQNFELQLRDLASGAQNEAKSSAGDKHETARAMAQLEQEKLGKQLNETQLMLQELDRLNFQIKGDKIIQGSMIETNHGLILLAIAFGRLELNGESLMVISMHSPLALQLLSKRKKENFIFNSIHYTIIDFC